MPAQALNDVADLIAILGFSSALACDLLEVCVVLKCFSEEKIFELVCQFRVTRFDNCIVSVARSFVLLLAHLFLSSKLAELDELFMEHYLAVGGEASQVDVDKVRKSYESNLTKFAAFVWKSSLY